jgi:DNA-binding response OmpR family regulator
MGDTKDIAAGPDAGADEYLTKPWTKLRFWPE